MPKIEQIKLENNRLTGTIPGSLAYLPELRVLWLEGNNLQAGRCRLTPGNPQPGCARLMTQG
jgi:hypothetical protein